jgi:hypothetical protein
LFPTITLPKLKLAGFDPRTPGVTPVADSGIVRLGLEALEVTLTAPVALPAAVGVNVTLKVALWPAARVTGAEMPLIVKPVPLIATWERVTLVPPVFVTDSDSELLFPTSTLPKLRLVGLDDKAPGVTPVPLTGMVKVGLEAFEVMVMLPLAAAAALGAKLTLKLELCPAASVTGVVTPLKLNPVPVMPT